MSYTVNNTRGSVVSTVNNNATASVGGITLIGKNYTGYGELIAEDFIKILENNANTTAPTGPLEGQLWWDTTNQSLKVYNSSTQWHPVTVHVGATYPHTATRGALWFNTTTGQLNVNSDGTINGYQQLATASESSSAEVIVLTTSQVDDDATKNNGYNTTTANQVEVIAQVLTKGDGTTKDVIQVWSPAHFSFSNPNNPGSVEQAIYDSFSADITVSSVQNTDVQGTLIRGSNTQDNLISEGVSADTIGGKSADDIVNDSRKFTLQTSSFTATAGNQIGVDTTSASVTVTLPATPSNGDIVTLLDSHHQWGGTYPCIVARNGNTINGATSDLTLNTTGQAIKLLYNGSGWRTFVISNGEAIYG